jgi:hypothetical protein
MCIGVNLIGVPLAEGKRVLGYSKILAVQVLRPTKASITDGEEKTG